MKTMRKLTNSRREVDCSIRRGRRLLPLQVLLCLSDSSLFHVSLYGSLMQLSPLCYVGDICFYTLQTTCTLCCMCTGECAVHSLSTDELCQFGLWQQYMGGYSLRGVGVTMQ